MKTPSLRDKLLERVRAEGAREEARESALEGDSLTPRVTATFSARALRGNYTAIQAQNPSLGIIAMVKANAYGHGMLWAAREIAGLPQLYAYGVATLEEGRELRDGLGARHRRSRIHVFSGAAPWSEDIGGFCEAHGLTPVIASEEDWSRFRKGGWTKRIPYELKFNTGMNRLGIQHSLASRVRAELAQLPAEEHPQGVFSHLAVSENPEHRLTREQFDRFRKIRSELHSVCPGARFHIANSAAIWNSKHYSLDTLTDLVRPGLALYGTTPWPDAPARGLEPVLTLTSRVMQVRKLQAGETVGYGATYAVPRDQTEQRIGILPLGYADGWSRHLSNAGFAQVGTRRERFVGIVSMDLSAVTLGPHAKVGDSVELIGPSLPAWIQAQAAGTIPYELFTSLSSRVRRIYGE